MKIGLFFGSFNPVHTGHMIIANYMLDNGGLDEIWFVISPQNPFKTKDKLLDENKRLQLLELAIEDNPNFKTCDIEFGLEKPSYTIITLKELSKTYPDRIFIPIIGGDNFLHFDKWKDHEMILKNYTTYIYPRSGLELNSLNDPNLKLFKVPLLDISSTYLRETIQAGRSIRYLVPDKVRNLIEKEGLYRS